MSASKIILIVVGILALANLFLVLPAQAAEDAIDPNFPSDQFFLAKIISVQDQAASSSAETPLLKTAEVRFLTGSEKNQIRAIDFGGAFADSKDQEIEPGETVVVLKSQVFDEVSYYIVDKFRLPALSLFILAFLAVVGILGRTQGLRAVLGLVVTILAITYLIMPGILNGLSPLLVGFGGVLMIAVISIYLSHGLSRTTSLAVLSTLITLCLAFLLATFSLEAVHLFGLGTEEARILDLNLGETVDLAGVLLVAIILGTLGILDDVTTTQVRTVYEISSANPALSKKELYRKGMAVGKEHVSALVNTLFLAYIGASFPLFILFSLSAEPLWVIINREILSEEIIRTIVGSTALLLAIPISTMIAVRFLNPKNNTTPRVAE